ncbi:hypothetical protein CPC19_10865 [Cycloclasticus sp. PY97N]|uniref:Transposase n=1 Tax=Cycloclasticus pugetii TaxID=34068 RepID=A0AB33Z5H0_9GAMM|nr:hypothetical protein CPC19_10865 [Cycloclasticus sp. PY97N]EPD14382.1 hypothetical protein L196_02755 [Cycloclasticus pugetii]
MVKIKLLLPNKQLTSLLYVAMIKHIVLYSLRYVETAQTKENFKTETAIKRYVIQHSLSIKRLALLSANYHLPLNPLIMKLTNNEC